MRDPRDNKVFYIGKGEGNRVFSHFIEAQTARASDQRWSSKIRRIVEIWESEEDVDWFIVRRNLQQSINAFDVEAAIIDALAISQNGPALNDVAGHGLADRGILNIEQVAALAVQEVKPGLRYPTVFIFPIHAALQEGHQMYDATRGWWRVNPTLRGEPNAVGVGLVNGVSAVAFSITDWEKDQTTGKWQFEGERLENHELVGKNWTAVIRESMGYWQRGNFVVVEFDGERNFRFKHGNANHGLWRPL